MSGDASPSSASCFITDNSWCFERSNEAFVASVRTAAVLWPEETRRREQRADVDRRSPHGPLRHYWNVSITWAPRCSAREELIGPQVYRTSLLLTMNMEENWGRAHELFTLRSLAFLPVPVGRYSQEWELQTESWAGCKNVCIYLFIYLPSLTEGK